VRLKALFIQLSLDFLDHRWIFDTGDYFDRAASALEVLRTYAGFPTSIVICFDRGFDTDVPLTTRIFD
jgi:hypothetical protein